MGLIRTLYHALADAIVPPPQETSGDGAPGDDIEKHSTKSASDKQEKISTGKRGGILAKPIRVYKLLTNQDFRWKSSMRITVLWAITLIIVGIVFVCLSATGVYPESTPIQKELDVYAESIVKYSLYILAGLMTLFAAYLASREILHKSNASPALIMPKLLLLVSILIALATIGMTIQIMVDVNNAYTLAWWSWLIMAIIILQRLFFSCACSAALWTLFDATKCSECREVYNRGSY